MTTPSLLLADARALPLPDASVDLVVTSPPYWRKRDYGVTGQLGQETTPAAYTAALMDCLTEWWRVLTPTGSVFLNVGDGYHRRALAGIPGRIETAAADAGWLLRNRIIWTKTRGNPDPARDRLTPRHEYVLHLTPSRRYHYDLAGYTQQYGPTSGANPGDVWAINPERGLHTHLAPYPVELARRAILLGCPRTVCTTCGHTPERILAPSGDLDTTRPQARRAMQLAKEAGLTEAHLAAIRATGISDAGKALLTQTGTGRNSAEVQALAAEAKAVLGGYFREFTFGPKVTVSWTDCGHDARRPGRVLDPFSGTGTTGIAAAELDLTYIGADLSAEAHAIATTRLTTPGQTALAA
ncbi:DNA-methyltransferase [Streptomyces microflavus]|uniref:DNA-methyltransferase n=1 Tax=Streptomyces microflavus TaxID=1919 RepID=UPI002E3805EF|nr:DNA methyltransferase [Streptomyces microflavus]